MFSQMLFVIMLSACTFLDGTAAKIAPDYITPCPGLKSDCLKTTMQQILPHFVKGIPELGIDPADPMDFKHANMDLTGGLTLEFYNGNVTGLRNCIIDSASYKNGETDITAHCDLTVKAKYKAHGKLLIMSINGDGDAIVKLKNFIMRLSTKQHDVVRDGVTYHEIKSFSYKHAYGGPVTFDLTNLFKGSPILSATILQFFNINWKEIMEEFGKPVLDFAVDSLMDIVKKFLSVIPKDELYIDV